jgi:hypothetical protein
MKKVWSAALAASLGLGSVAVAQDQNNPGTPAGPAKPNPARAQNVVPITEFIAPPEFPFAPKPKPSLWKRLWVAMKKPFLNEPEPMEMPIGAVPMPGVLPTVGQRPAQMPMKK